MEWWEEIINGAKDKASGDSVHKYRESFYKLIDTYVAQGYDKDEAVAVALDIVAMAGGALENLYALWAVKWANANDVELEW
jgi:hypothetical protein